jgi:hypothetical protein
MFAPVDVTEAAKPTRHKPYLPRDPKFCTETFTAALMPRSEWTFTESSLDRATTDEAGATLTEPAKGSSPHTSKKFTDPGGDEDDGFCCWTRPPEAISVQRKIRSDERPSPAGFLADSRSPPLWAPPGLLLLRDW